jgi:hypothetical protein
VAVAGEIFSLAKPLAAIIENSYEETIDPLRSAALALDNKT